MYFSDESLQSTFNEMSCFYHAEIKAEERILPGNRGSNRGKQVTLVKLNIDCTGTSRTTFISRNMAWRGQ